MTAGASLGSFHFGRGIALGLEADLQSNPLLMVKCDWYTAYDKWGQNASLRPSFGSGRYARKNSWAYQ